ncbi:hypothetical protein ACIP9H_34135 [Streptomyces sp. NPDC088732]|uniref:hypothetical protein n=1 Tax=Streptomyces sp. NPDC088732 TaxID=3365879 RepID=UPI00382C84BB
MSTDLEFNAYAQAAQRARVVAEIARDRFAPPRTMSALGSMAAHLDAAANAFDAVPPGAYEELPTEATEALFRADEIAAANPAGRFPAQLSEYVLVPLVDRELPFPARLDPVDVVRFAQREADLVRSLHRLHYDGDHQWQRTDDWLRQVFTVWQQHARLADEIRTDNARPSVRP